MGIKEQLERIKSDLYEEFKFWEKYYGKILFPYYFDEPILDKVFCFQFASFWCDSIFRFTNGELIFDTHISTRFSNSQLVRYSGLNGDVLGASFFWDTGIAPKEFDKYDIATILDLKKHNFLDFSIRKGTTLSELLKNSRIIPEKNNIIIQMMIEFEDYQSNKKIEELNNDPVYMEMREKFVDIASDCKEYNYNTLKSEGKI